MLVGSWLVKSVKIIFKSLTLFSRSICLYFRVMKFKSAISDSVCRASIKRLMYLFTRVPGVLYTTLVEKEERFLSFSEAVLNALLCSTDEERSRGFIHISTVFINIEIFHCCSYYLKLTDRMRNPLSRATTKDRDLISVWLPSFKNSLAEILISLKSMRKPPLHSRISILIHRNSLHILPWHFSATEELISLIPTSVTLPRRIIRIFFLMEGRELWTSQTQDNQALYDTRKVLLSKTV